MSLIKKLFGIKDYSDEQIEEALKSISDTMNTNSSQWGSL